MINNKTASERVQQDINSFATLSKCDDILKILKNEFSFIYFDLIYNHKNIVNSFATKVNLKKFTGPEYTGV
jgi:hypothetical protein